MTLGQHAAIAVGDRDGERAAVFEPQRQRLTDQRLEIGRRVHRSFDPMHARESAGRSARQSPDSGRCGSEPGGSLAFRLQIAHARILLDQLHHAFPIVPQVGQNLHMRLLVPLLVAR